MFKRHFVMVLASAAVVAGCANGSRAVSVADTPAAQARLSTPNKLAAKAGPTGTLKASGPFSAFTPTHDAFAKVPAMTTETLDRLFDEAPAPPHLTGFIAARYPFEAFNALNDELLG